MPIDLTLGAFGSTIELVLADTRADGGEWIGTIDLTLGAFGSTIEMF